MTESDVLNRSVFAIVYAGGILWVAYQAIREFGWQGLFIKCALLIDTIFFWFVVEFHRLPWTLLRSRYTDGPLTSARFIETFLYLLLCFYLLASPRSLRLLMRPWAKWTIYGSSISWMVGFYSAAKGWV